MKNDIDTDCFPDSRVLSESELKDRKSTGTVLSITLKDRSLVAPVVVSNRQLYRIAQRRIASAGSSTNSPNQVRSDTARPVKVTGR